MHAVEVRNEGRSSRAVEVKVEMETDASPTVAGALEVGGSRDRGIHAVGLDTEPLLQLTAKRWQRKVRRENWVSVGVESHIALNDGRGADQRHGQPEILGAVDVDVLDAIAPLGVDQHRMTHSCAAG